MNALVSVVVPVYRVPLDLFRLCLDSLVRQQGVGIEFLIVSDGASEEICSCVREYCARDGRVRLLEKSHQGVSSARNCGVEKATGEYVAFADADDYFEDGILEKAYSKAVGWQSDVLIWDVITERGQVRTRRSFATEDIAEIAADQREKMLRYLITMGELDSLSLGGPWCKLYRREVLLRHRFRNEFTLCQDRVLNYEVYDDPVLHLSYLHEPGYCYRWLRPDSCTNVFRPDALEIGIRYVAELARMSKGRYPALVGREMWEMMWRAWFGSVRSPENHAPFFRKYGDFTKRLSDRSVRRLLAEVDGEESLSFKLRAELFALRRGIMLFFWYHALVIEWARLFSWVRSKIRAWAKEVVV